MLHYVGAEVKPTSSETLAYTHEYIFGRLMGEILKKAGGRNAEEKQVEVSGLDEKDPLAKHVE